MTRLWSAQLSEVAILPLPLVGDPAAVPDGILEELKRRQDENGLIRFERRVRVVEGVIFDCFGLYEGMDDPSVLRSYSTCLGARCVSFSLRSWWRGVTLREGRGLLRR